MPLPCHRPCLVPPLPSHCPAITPPSGRVVSITPSSPAATIGLQPGDALLDVGTDSDARAWLMSAGGGTQRVVRRGEESGGARGEWPTLFAQCTTLNEVLAPRARGYRFDPATHTVSPIVIPWPANEPVGGPTDEARPGVRALAALELRIKRAPRPYNPLWRAELTAVGSSHPYPHPHPHRIPALTPPSHSPPYPYPTLI